MIAAENLVKHYGPTRAVDQLSFRVEKGQVLGLLGPNGAGKSTTIKMIVGFLRPDAGTAKLRGINIATDPIRAKTGLGYLPENASCYTDLTVHQYLTYLAALHGLTGARLRECVHTAIQRCFLQHVAHQSIDTLSKGYRHRTCLAQSIVHDPDILIFDEPTDGLDPNQKQEMRHLISTMAPEKAIIISTHILEEVDAVCTDTIIINHGQIVAHGTPASLRQRCPQYGSIHATFSAPPTAATLTTLATLPNVKTATTLTDLHLIIDLEDRSATARHHTMDTVRHALTHPPHLPTELYFDKGDLSAVFRLLTTTSTAAP